MYTYGFSDFDRIVFMLLGELPSIPAEDLVGIVRHYLRSSTPASSQVDLLLVAVSLPEFDDAQFEAVRAARADVPLQVRGARLAGLAARPDADPRALLRGERSLKARLYAAELTRSPQLLAELVVKAPPKLIIAALANPWRSEEVDLAAIDIIEEPHGYLRHNVEAMLRRSPRVEERVRASDRYSLRCLAWDWCDTPQERVEFATREISAAVAAGDTDRLIDAVLSADDAPQLPPTLLRDLALLFASRLSALADEDSFRATWRMNDLRKNLDQVRRVLSTQADDPHPPVAVLFDRIAQADYGEPQRQAEQRLLAEAVALLGHGPEFWTCVAGSFDTDASIPEIVSLALLLASRPKRRVPAKVPYRLRGAAVSTG